MKKSFKLPDLGEGIHEGEVMAIHVSEGDAVEEGDVILEVETDKAAVDIPSPYTGTIKEILVAEGDTVNVGDEIVAFDVAEEELSDEDEETESADKEGREKADDEEKESAEKEKKKKAEASESEEKERKAADSGKKSEKKEESRESEPTDEESGKEKRKKAEAGDEKAGGKKKKTGDRQGPVPASPATRRLARELEVDLREVEPTGRGGVVTSEDVRAHAEEGKAEKKEAEAAEKEQKEPGEAREAEEKKKRKAKPMVQEAPELPDFEKWGPVERVAVRSVRRATARQMAIAWSQIPHVTTNDMADVTALEEFRQKHKAAVSDQGGRLTPTIFAMKAAVAALKRYPNFNSSLDPKAGEIVRKNYYHIGVAVDSDDGLFVPVIRDVDRKSLTELSVEFAETVEKTRNRKVSGEDFQGGTFTITNMGSLRGGHFTPIINWPQVAILGMGKAEWQPVVREKGDGRREIVTRLMMPVVLTMDHRVLDGGDAARFLDLVIKALEDPDRLMLTMS
ncbi:MAG: dihydrolipoamide acetyltransferase family protein [Desulfococcaceae bacterium]